MTKSNVLMTKSVASKHALAVTLVLAAVTSPSAGQAQSQGQSAFFVDCAGNYARVSTKSAQVESQGKVQRLKDARLPPAARDGCTVHEVKAGATPSLVVLTVQNFMWDSDKADPPYSRLTLQLPDLRILEREPLRKLPSMRSSPPTVSRSQQAFFDRLGRQPFASRTAMLSKDGRIAVIAELPPNWVGFPSVISPEMTMSGQTRSPLTGRFAVYDVSAGTELGRYEIPGLQTDLVQKTLLAPDGSFVFHAHNGVDGHRKLFLVTMLPRPAVVEVAYGGLDPWWSAGVIVPAAP